MPSKNLAPLGYSTWDVENTLAKWTQCRHRILQSWKVISIFCNCSSCTASRRLVSRVASQRNMWLEYQHGRVLAFGWAGPLVRYQYINGEPVLENSLFWFKHRSTPKRCWMRTKSGNCRTIPMTLWIIPEHVSVNIAPEANLCKRQQNLRPDLLSIRRLLVSPRGLLLKVAASAWCLRLTPIEKLWAELALDLHKIQGIPTWSYWRTTSYHHC